MMTNRIYKALYQLIKRIFQNMIETIKKHKVAENSKLSAIENITK